MRGSLLLASTLFAAAFAGCLAADPLATTAVPLPKPTVGAVPAGATVVDVEDGVALVWESVPLPLREDFEVPAGTTLVRATIEIDEALSPFIELRNADSLRRRCNNPVVVSWSEDIETTKTCAGLAVVDPLPATWQVRASVPMSAGLGGPAAALPIGDVEEVVGLVRVEFLAVPLDGLVASLDLSQLSMPAFEVGETEVFEVPSHDGVLLHVEVTRPKTDAKVPAVIESNPYNTATRNAGGRAADSLIKDWGARGYAIVAADVRGYGESGGCVEVWSANEQMDQKALVEWVAAQEWSDGNVGFYGQSYVATTPVSAAVQDPEALKAIVAVAPVTDAYWDWHFGGVPNGENVGSPAGYQQLGATADVDPTDPITTAMNHGNGLCDPTLAARANDPRAIYDAFYVERNLTLRAKDVTAAVLYTQGFEDTNVKSAMIVNWFNALGSPKLGLFGHWVHQHPPRADYEVLFLGWMDQYVKGKPLGFERLPVASTLTQAGTHRATATWPPVDAATTTFWPDLGAGTLGGEPVDGSASVLLAHVALPSLPAAPSRLVLEGTTTEAFELAGGAGLRLVGELRGSENGHVAAWLYDDDVVVTWGMANLAHRNGHDRYDPVAPGEVVTMTLPFLPTDHLFEAGSKVRIELRSARTGDWFLTTPTEPGVLVLHGGADGTRLLLPTLDPATAEPTPLSMKWM